MKERQFMFSDESGSHNVVLAYVPGTSGKPYGFGHGNQRRHVELNEFFVQTTPVTQALWTYVMGENPAINIGPNHPVENVSWEHITRSDGFLDRINSIEILNKVSDGNVDLRFRLPFEAEWEYAARGGPNWKDNFAFSGSNNADEVAWYGRRWNSTDEIVLRILGWPTGWRVVNRIRKLWPRETRTHPVCSKSPNQLGLYDMSGNVWEWCEDVCTDDLQAVPANGSPFEGPGEDRRLRGGCHHNWDLHCRVWWRYGIQPDAHDGCIGFRLVLAPHSQ